MESREKGDYDVVVLHANITGTSLAKLYGNCFMTTPSQITNSAASDQETKAKSAESMKRAAMQKFVSLGKATPPKREASIRRKDFDEIYPIFAPDSAKSQASRCAQCGVPFCQVHCPLHNNIPDWLMLTADGRLEEAYHLSQSTNAFPEICGRICPQDRLCEGNCVIEKGFDSVTIGAVEAYLTDTAWDNNWVKPITAPTRRSETVGIIGSGPAGLAAAEQLLRLGYIPHIYERADQPGGLLTYGIPNFKLDKQAVKRRIDWLVASGAVIHTKTEIGHTVKFASLQQKHAAILLATGVYQARRIDLPGRHLTGIVQALDYLIACNRISNHGFDQGESSKQLDPALNAAGKRVVVIGGGDTAMDCVRSAVRQGATSVTCLYRRDRANMPGSQREVSNAEEEGVVFNFLAAPHQFIGDNESGGNVTGKVTGLTAHRIHLGVPDASGRQTPSLMSNSRFDVPADLVIEALGFDPDNYPLQLGQTALDVSKNGQIKIDGKSKMTSIPGVFAAGDNVRGASLVVWAIKDGRDAALAIHKYIMDVVQHKSLAAE